MFFSFQDQWQIVVGLALLLIGAAEAGYRIGNQNHNRIDESARGQITTMEAAMLGRQVGGRIANRIDAHRENPYPQGTEKTEREARATPASSTKSKRKRSEWWSLLNQVRTYRCLSWAVQPLRVFR